MTKYIKKPVAIEAFLLNKDDGSIMSALNFMGQAVRTRSDIECEKFYDYCRICDRDGGIKIKTLEGEMMADFGDFIIKGIKGEFYPCKPDIFELTYFTEKEYAEHIS